MNASEKVFLNGKLVPADEAYLSVFDVGFRAFFIVKFRISIIKSFLLLDNLLL